MCDVLDRLHSAGIALMLPGDSYSIPATDAERYLENPDAYLARLHGIDLESYLLWKSGKPIECSFFIKRLKRNCRHQIVRDYEYIEPSKYEALLRDGDYCALHGGTERALMPISETPKMSAVIDQSKV